jgi:4-alpha-glucanotransferase
MARAAGVAADAPLAEAIVGVYRALARSPACLVSATLEDALQVVERPNLPGTDARQRPNWSLALPRPIEELPDDPFVTRLAGVLRR